MLRLNSDTRNLNTAGYGNHLLNPISGILLQFVVLVVELNTGCLEHFLRLPAGMVFALTNDTPDPAVDNQHGTGAAGCHAGVDRSAVDGYAKFGGLANGVLFGVQTTAQLGKCTLKTESFNQFTFRVLDGYLEKNEANLNMTV